MKHNNFKLSFLKLISIDIIILLFSTYISSLKHHKMVLKLNSQINANSQDKIRNIIEKNQNKISKN